MHTHICIHIQIVVCTCMRVCLCVTVFTHARVQKCTYIPDLHAYICAYIYKM